MRTFIVETVTAGTPVLASDGDGNIGMPGKAYPGYFAVGDDAALAARIARCRDQQRFLARLARHCAAGAPRFTPQQERRALARLMRALD